MNPLPASQPISVLELVSNAVKAVSSQHLPAEGRKALAEGVINSQVKDPGQREILLKLAVESMATREDLDAVYQRLGGQVDPNGLLRMPTRFERSQAELVLRAINLAATDVGLAPHPYFEGALKLVVVDDGGTLGDAMKGMDFKGPHAGTGNNIWRRIEMELAGRTPETDEERAVARGLLPSMVFDIRHVEPSHEFTANRDRDPVIMQLNLDGPGPKDPPSDTTHRGGLDFSTDYRMLGDHANAGSWPAGVPLQSARDLEHFISRVKTEPARFGVASVEAFDTFVGLYRSTNELTTKGLVALIGALEVAVDVKLDQKGARALKEAFNSEPRMPLESLIAKFAFFTPTENRPQDYQGLPPLT